MYRDVIEQHMGPYFKVDPLVSNLLDKHSLTCAERRIVDEYVRYIKEEASFEQYEDLRR